jgi:hypothetical protein
MAATATMKGNGLATIVATIAKAAICVVPIIPAVRVNLDAAAGQGEAWTIFAIGSVMAGAVFIELCLEGRGFVKTALFAMLATFFVSLNVLNAIGNAASHSDVARDVASSRLSQKQRLEDRRNELSQGRRDQVAIAGNTTPDSIDAEIRAAKSTNAKLWNASFSCDPAWITRDQTKEFCGGLAKLEAKKAAAIKRDEIERQLAKLDAQDVEAPPSAVDSYVANMGRFIGLLGYSVDDKAKELIAASRDWLKGIGVELLAAFGPAALLSLLSRPAGHQHQAPQSQPQPQRKPEKAAKAIVAPIVAETSENASAAVPATVAIVATSQSGDDPEIDAFHARRLETVQGEFITAAALFNAWQADCVEHGIEPGSQKAFSQRIQKRVGYDRNSGRPKYCHVRLKPAHVRVAHAPLRLAVVNA